MREHETKIYDLVDLVVKCDAYPWSSDPLVSLYQKLFITQAALCELYFEYDAEGDCALVLTPISAYLVKTRSAVSNRDHPNTSLSNVENSAPNFEFFWDERNFFTITQDDVKTLLERFWTQYTSYMENTEAYEVLGLPSDASWAHIKDRYRALIAVSHPDKGGTEEGFIKIRMAYESLKNAC